MEHVHFVDTTIRDGHQSLWAERMSTGGPTSGANAALSGAIRSASAARCAAPHSARFPGPGPAPNPRPHRMADRTDP